MPSVRRKLAKFAETEIMYNIDFRAVPEHIKMAFRPSVLEPKRVQSVFKDRIERHKEEIEELVPIS
jgi:hypothetical protein